MIVSQENKWKISSTKKIKKDPNDSMKLIHDSHIYMGYTISNSKIYKYNINEFENSHKLTLLDEGQIYKFNSNNSFSSTYNPKTGNTFYCKTDSTLKQVTFVKINKAGKYQIDSFNYPLHEFLSGYDLMYFKSKFLVNKNEDMLFITLEDGMILFSIDHHLRNVKAIGEECCRDDPVLDAVTFKDNGILVLQTSCIVLNRMKQETGEPYMAVQYQLDKIMGGYCFWREDTTPDDEFLLLRKDDRATLIFRARFRIVAVDQEEEELDIIFLGFENLSKKFKDVYQKAIDMENQLLQILVKTTKIEINSKGRSEQIELLTNRLNSYLHRRIDKREIVKLFEKYLSLQTKMNISGKRFTVIGNSHIIVSNKYEDSYIISVVDNAEDS